jgi:hypothetical protein
MELAIHAPMVRLLARGVLMASLVAACGGRTEGGGSETSEREPEPGRNEGNEGSEGNKGSEGKWSSPGVEGDTPLGECVLGFPPHRPEGRSCPWLADDLCYEAREMACNCVCPRNRDSQCSSGFDAGPDGRVAVYCR